MCFFFGGRLFVREEGVGAREAGHRFFFSRVCAPPSLTTPPAHPTPCLTVQRPDRGSPEHGDGGCNQGDGIQGELGEGHARRER